MCKAFRHVKVDTLSQPEAFSRILVPGTGKLGVQGVLERRETQGCSAGEQHGHALSWHKLSTVRIQRMEVGSRGADEQL